MTIIVLHSYEGNPFPPPPLPLQKHGLEGTATMGTAPQFPPQTLISCYMTDKGYLSFNLRSAHSQQHTRQHLPLTDLMYDPSQGCLSMNKPPGDPQGKVILSPEQG